MFMHPNGNNLHSSPICGTLPPSRKRGISMSKKTMSTLMMMLTALIWGLAFIAQRAGMDHVGPFTFNATRSYVAGLFLLPVRLLFRSGAKPSEHARRKTWLGGILCGVILFLASALQQFGILYTSVSKTSFITTLYIVLVPLLGLLYGKRVRARAMLAVAIASVGLYLLCIPSGGERLSINRGDLLVLVCALLFSAHILVIDHFSPWADGILMSCIQFFVAAILSTVAMLLFEKPSAQGILACWWPILYTGVFSSGVGYTLQILGQRHTSPTVASLILSLESVFGALFGFLLLSERFMPREATGMLLMLGATLLAQLPERGKASHADA